MGYSDYNNNGTDKLYGTPANWSEARVPTGIDIARCEGTSDDDLLLDENASCQGFVTTVDYDGNIDTSDGLSHAFTTDGLVLDHPGTFDLGLGTTWTITGGTFDVDDIGSLVYGTSTIVLEGACNLISGVAEPLWNVTIAAGGTTTVSWPASVACRGLVTVNGELVANWIIGIDTPGGAAGDLQMGASGVISGSKQFGISKASEGRGISVFAAGASITVATLDFRYWESDAVWTPGTYAPSTRLLIYAHTSGALDTDITLSAGTYNLDTDVTLQSGSTGTVTIDFANNPTFVVTGALTFDADSSGNLVLTNPGANGITVQGDVADELTGGGSVIVNSCPLTLPGTNNVSIALCAATWGAIVINKPAGTVTVEDDWIAASLDVLDGTIDFNGKTVTFSGAVALASGVVVRNLIGATIDCDTLTAECDLGGSASWTLNTANGGTVTGATITNCNATGGIIDATDNCVDGGGNSARVLFAPTMPGLEFTLPDYRPHCILPTNRDHFRFPDNRTHFTIPQSD